MTTDYGEMTPYQKADVHFGPNKYAKLLLTVLFFVFLHPQPICIFPVSGQTTFQSNHMQNLCIIRTYNWNGNRLVSRCIEEINFLLTNEKRLVKKILIYIDAAFTLHNILIILIDDVKKDWDFDEYVAIIDYSRSIEKIWKDRDFLNQFQMVHQGFGGKIS